MNKLSKVVMTYILLAFLLMLNACNTTPPTPCFNKGEVGEITQIQPKGEKNCGRYGCTTSYSTIITVNVNGLPRGCNISDQTIDIPAGTKVNFPFAVRVW